MSQRARKNLKLVVVGARGRMGAELVAMAPELGFDVVAHVNQPADWHAVDAKAVDIAVDFSSPAGFAAALKWCVRHKTPIVSGTTGLSRAQRASLKSAGRRIPVLYSANMSLGIAALVRMLQAVPLLENWDFHVDEIHHKAKKDAPSGTALLLNEALSEVLQRRPPPPNSIRGGGVPGLHQIWCLGPEEAVLLQHTAFHRKVFARGALKAARWLFDKGRSGLYDMQDLIQP